MAGRIPPRIFRFGVEGKKRILELRSDAGSEIAYETLTDDEKTGFALQQIYNEVLGEQAEGRQRQVNRKLIVDLIWAFSETYRWEAEPWASMDDWTKPPRLRDSYRLLLKEMSYQDLHRAHNVITPLLCQHLVDPTDPASLEQSTTERENDSES